MYEICSYAKFMHHFFYRFYSRQVVNSRPRTPHGQCGAKFNPNFVIFSHKTDVESQETVGRLSLKNPNINHFASQPLLRFL